MNNHLAWIGILVLAVSCEEQRIHVSSKTREISSEEVERIRTHLNEAQRFGPAFGISAEPTEPRPNQGAAPGEAADFFELELPNGWMRKDPSEMRILNFGVRSAPEIQAYVTFAGGPGSTLAGNVNRWRGQMSEPAMSPAALVGLPTTRFMNQDTPMVELEGEFRGMGGPPKADWALMGLVASRAEGAMTFKLIGPASEVRRERDNFLALAASIRPRQDLRAPTSGGAPSSNGPSSNKPRFASRERKMLVDVPEAWQPGRESSMRLMSYKVGEKTDFSVFALAGTVDWNVNRWRNQFRESSLTGTEVAALPKLPMLGVEATYLTMTGAFKDGMTGLDFKDAMMLAVVGIVDGETITVKMVGPRSEVEPRVGEFEAFVRSMRGE